MIQKLTITTESPGLIDMTRDLSKVVRDSGAVEGLCTVMVQHTSASLTIQENASPDARNDLQAWLARLVPDGDARFTHTSEGPDDMPSHIKSALTSTTLSIPILQRDLALGTWQGVFLWEHRSRGADRTIVVHIQDDNRH